MNANDLKKIFSPPSGKYVPMNYRPLLHAVQKTKKGEREHRDSTQQKTMIWNALIHSLSILRFSAQCKLDKSR